VFRQSIVAALKLKLEAAARAKGYEDVTARIGRLPKLRFKKAIQKIGRGRKLLTQIKSCDKIALLANDSEGL
jgi:hypothetical protein